MKLRLAPAALLLACLSASAALNAYRTTINFSQAVKLPDGNILRAGLYDVEIEYKGFGNTAQFHFFKGKTPLGTMPAEARGFPSQPPPADGKAGDVKKFDPTKVEVDDTKLKKPSNPSDQNAKVLDKTTPLGDKWPGESPDAHAFSWGAYGFTPTVTGKSVPVGQSVKISIDSSNSAAGFFAVLPAAPKGK
jgi:hypothetical protein